MKERQSMSRIPGATAYWHVKQSGTGERDRRPLPLGGCRHPFKVFCYEKTVVAGVRCCRGIPPVIFRGLARYDISRLRDANGGIAGQFGEFLRRVPHEAEDVPACIDRVCVVEIPVETRRVAGEYLVPAVVERSVETLLSMHSISRASRNGVKLRDQRSLSLSPGSFGSSGNTVKQSPKSYPHFTCQPSSS